MPASIQPVICMPEVELPLAAEDWSMLSSSHRSETGRLRWTKAKKIVSLTWGQAGVKVRANHRTEHI